MTPEEARALLDGTTPGQWELSSSRSVVGIDIVMYDGKEMERQNVALAAPVLAETIAGMREEWGVSYRLDHENEARTTWGWETREDAERSMRLMSRVYVYGLVRRYVTEPEEA